MIVSSFLPHFSSLCNGLVMEDVNIIGINLVRAGERDPGNEVALAFFLLQETVF